MMEVNMKSSCVIKGQSKCSSTSDAEKKLTSENAERSIFVNHAAISWHENRRKWIGDQLNKPKQPPKEPVISWSADYDDLLSTNDPFPKSIPLPEMVDFLVDIWYDEGLYDC